MAAGTRSTATLHHHALAGACASALLASSALAVAAEAPQVTWLDRIEVTATPIPGTTIDAAQLPYMVQSATNSELSRARSNNLGDLLQRRFVGVDGNDVQGSAFQNDLTFHGFRASALPGASQGVSVYLDGVRFNEPFADIVSWDMLPESAINAVTLMPGSNPLFGPNTLGGAVVLSTASGLTSPGVQGELSIGSGARKRLDASYGLASQDGWHGFVAVTGFDENGWRDASEGRLGTVFGKVGKQGEQTDWSLSLLHGRSRLIGNGLLPDTRYTDDGPEPGLYRADRRAVYTSPDLTRNRNTLFTAQLDHRFTADTALHALAYARVGRRDTVNGDIGEDYEEFVEECASGYAADGSALDADCDVARADADALPTGALNTTQMRQEAQGLAVNLSRQWGRMRSAPASPSIAAMCAISNSPATVGCNRTARSLPIRMPSARSFPACAAAPRRWACSSPTPGRWTLPPISVPQCAGIAWWWTTSFPPPRTATAHASASSMPRPIRPWV